MSRGVLNSHAVRATIPKAEAYPRILKERRNVSGTTTKSDPPNRYLVWCRRCRGARGVEVISHTPEIR
jgi:hypothetical protein